MNTDPLTPADIAAALEACAKATEPEREGS